MKQAEIWKKNWNNVPLKYLSNFWGTLDVPFINCEINLNLNCSENWIIIATDVANQGATFSITDTKIYVPVVTLSIQDNKKLLEQLKDGFKRTINWNKYQPKISTERPNQHLNLLMDPVSLGMNFLGMRHKERVTNDIIFRQEK